MGRLDAVENVRHFVPVDAGPPLRPLWLGACAAVQAELEGVVHEADRLGLGAFLGGSLQDGLHGPLDDASLAVAADDGDDLVGHGVVCRPGSPLFTLTLTRRGRAKAHCMTKV